jgi:hypothetical protein
LIGIKSGSESEKKDKMHDCFAAPAKEHFTITVIGQQDKKKTINTVS